MGFTIKGVVVGGNKIGREIGFPTANLVVSDSVDVANGVYSARVTIQNEVFLAMANLGHKPSINGDGARVLEANIFDFNADIYEQTITVELLDFIRPERRFSSFDELKTQINRDKQIIFRIFKKQ